MDIERTEKLLAIRNKMRQDIHAAMDEAEHKLQQLQEEYSEQESKECREGEYYPRMRSPHIRDHSFSFRISPAEEQFLKEEARKQQKSVADLIREGYIAKAKIVKTFERI